MDISKKSLSEQIYDILKKEIITHEINYDDGLVNRTLQERFNVSSSPVRDAINRLYMDGLIDEITNAGAKVTTFDLYTAIEVLDVLIMLSDKSVELSFARGNLSSLEQELSTIISAQRKSIYGDEYFENDYLFHRAFVEHAGNSKLLKLFDQYHALYEMLTRFYHDSHNPKLRDSAIDEHAKIITAVHEKNPADCQSMLKEHFKNAEQMFSRIHKKLDEECANGKC